MPGIRHLNGIVGLVGPSFSISVSGSPNTATYTVARSDGAPFGIFPDTATTSGLKAAIDACLNENDVAPLHIHFGVGRFHFLDAPVGNESWAGVEDHPSWGQSNPATAGIWISGEGIDVTIISNRTNWAGGTDTEPFSFTNAQNISISDLTVESCGSYKSTTDAIDFDQGARCRVDRVLIRRTRGRAMVFDGGDDGRYATDNLVANVIIQGRPSQPSLLASATGGTFAAGTVRYALAWVDQDLGGAGVAGTTKPSDPTTVTVALNGSVRVHIPRAPYSVTGTKIYRKIGAGAWDLLTTVSGNLPTSYVDTGAAGSTEAFGTLSTVPMGGIELLGCSSSVVRDCFVDGVGGSTAANWYGIHISRKAAVPTMSNRNTIVNNTVRGSRSHGIRIIGGNQNIISGNQVENCGVSGSVASSVRIESVAGVTADLNKVTDNMLTETRTADHPDGGGFTQYGVNIAATATPTGNVIEGNAFAGYTASVGIVDLGTGTKIRDNAGSGNDWWDGNGAIVAATSAPANPFTGALWVNTT